MVAMERTTSGDTAVVEPHLLKEIGSKLMSRSHPTKRPKVYCFL